MPPEELSLDEAKSLTAAMGHKAFNGHEADNVAIAATVAERAERTLFYDVGLVPDKDESSAWQMVRRQALRTLALGCSQLGRRDTEHAHRAAICWEALRFDESGRLDRDVPKQVARCIPVIGQLFDTRRNVDWFVRWERALQTAWLLDKGDGPLANCEKLKMPTTPWRKDLVTGIVRNTPQMMYLAVSDGSVSEVVGHLGRMTFQVEVVEGKLEMKLPREDRTLIDITDVEPPVLHAVLAGELAL